MASLLARLERTEFRDDVSGFVAREVVEACTVAGRYELPSLAGVAYSAFVDLSGGSADSMTLGIAYQVWRKSGAPASTWTWRGPGDLGAARRLHQTHTRGPPWRF